MVTRTAEILVTLLTPATWLVAILGVALRRGFVRQRVQEHRTWMPQWMFAVVDLLESEADCGSWFCSSISDFSG